MAALTIPALIIIVPPMLAAMHPRTRGQDAFERPIAADQLIDPERYRR
jgi:hypothetical protein